MYDLLQKVYGCLSGKQARAGGVDLESQQEEEVEATSSPVDIFYAMSKYQPQTKPKDPTY